MSQQTTVEATESSTVPSILLEDDQPPRTGESGAGTKFALGGEAPSGAERSGRRLPDSYGTGRLILLPRDPHSLYAHWDFTMMQQRALNRKSADRHLVVRIHAEAKSEKADVETHVHPESRHWFIQAPRSSQTYVAELGYYDVKKRWTTVALSGPATTPPERTAEDRTATFVTVPSMPVEPHTPEAAYWPARTGSESVSTEEFQSRVGVERFGNVEEPAYARRVSSAPIAEVAHSDVKAVFPPQVGWIPVFESSVGSESSAPDSLHGGDWTEQKEQELDAILEEMGSGSPSSLEFAARSSELGYSEHQGQRDFWFAVNAELVIYGSTVPGAQVMLDGKAVEMRPDGTFTCRFALPDGEFGAALTAQSTEGDIRSAHLQVRRSTDFRPEGTAMEASRVGDIAG